MEVRLTPELQAKVDRWSAETGRPAEELIEDAMVGYFDEIEQARNLLDNRYDDIKNGRVTPVNGEAFFENLRRREEELLKQPQGNLSQLPPEDSAIRYDRAGGI